MVKNKPNRPLNRFSQSFQKDAPVSDTQHLTISPLKTERRLRSGGSYSKQSTPCYCGVGVAVGSAVAIGSGVGVAIGSGVGVAIGSGVGVAIGSGVGVAVGSGVGVAVGSGVGVVVGSGVGVGVGVGIVPDLISLAFSAASVLMTSDACLLNWLSVSMACCL
jgi:hypothetical protein